MRDTCKEMGGNWKPYERPIGARQVGSQAKNERSWNQKKKNWETNGRPVRNHCETSAKLMADKWKTQIENKSKNIGKRMEDPNLDGTHEFSPLNLESSLLLGCKAR